MFPRYIDTHTHLNDPLFGDDWKNMISRALDAGTWMILVGSDFESSYRAVEIANHFPHGVYAAVGVHPLFFEREGNHDIMAVDKLINMDDFRELARHPKVVAIGEVGLDFHTAHFSGSGDELHRDLTIHLQYETLNRFLELSREFRLPLILHVRDAHEEMWRYLYEYNKKSIGFDARGVVHHFTGDWSQAVRYMNADFLLSFTGLLARSHTRSEVIAKTPLKNMVVESECPYLVSEPIGMSRSESSLLPSAIAQIAGIKGLPPDEISLQTTRNALRIFSKILRNLPA